MERVNSAIAQLQAELQRQREEITFLRSNRSTKPCLPDPERFNGQSFKFDTWLPSIKAKLRVDGQAIGDPIAQFYYVYLNLDSSVQAMVLPQLSQAESDENWDHTTILDQLSRVYDNPNKQQEAEDKLYTIRQNNDSLSAYIAKFERTLYEAGGQAWNDVNKISSFRNGLNTTIKNRLVQQLNMPRTYPEFLRTVQQLAARSTMPTPTTNPLPQTTHTRHDQMDLNVLSFNALDRYSAPPQQARSISPPLREQYRKDGKCVRCGSQDHWVKDCLLRPFSPRTRAKLQTEDVYPKTKTTGKVTIAAIDDDAYDEPDDRTIEIVDKITYAREHYNIDDPRHPDAWQLGIFEDESDN